MNATATRWAGVLAAIMILAACQSDSSVENEPPKLSSIPAVSADAALPFDAYQLSTSERAELRQSYLVLLTRCAARYGATAQPVNADSKLEKDSRMWGGRLGTMTFEHAAQYGYHAAPGGPVVESFGWFANDGTQPLDTVLFGTASAAAEQDPGATPKIAGLPKKGCVGAVTSSLGGDPENLVPDEGEKIRLKAYRDKRTRAAQKKWAECMSAAGYKYKTVDGPIDTYGAGQPLSTKEIAVATQDVKCTKTSRWSDTAFAIEKAYQEREISKNPQKWKAIRAKAERVLRNAKKLPYRHDVSGRGCCG